MRASEMSSCWRRERERERELSFQGGELHKKLTALFVHQSRDLERQFSHR